MPLSVADLFNHFNLNITGKVKWGNQINSNQCGVYVISLSDQSCEIKTTDKPEFSNAILKEWIDIVNNAGKAILIDNEPATLELLKKRLEKFWLPDETIIYIGKVGPNKGRTFKRRINEFYKTKLGCNKKHAGGNWINTLKNLSDLTIYYSVCDPLIEEKMIEHFSRQVSSKTKLILYDQINCLPFANKEINKSIRKHHSISGQTIECGSHWKK